MVTYQELIKSGVPPEEARKILLAELEELRKEIMARGVEWKPYYEPAPPPPKVWPKPKVVKPFVPLPKVPPKEYEEREIYPPWTTSEIAKRIETMPVYGKLDFKLGEGKEWRCERRDSRYECSANYREEIYHPTEVKRIAGRVRLVKAYTEHRIIPAVKGDAHYVIGAMLEKKPKRIVELKPL